MRKMKSIYGLVEIRAAAISAKMCSDARKGLGDTRTTAQLLAAAIPAAHTVDHTNPVGSF